MIYDERQRSRRYARIDQTLRDWATAIVWAGATVWMVFLWVAYCMGWGT